MSWDVMLFKPREDAPLTGVVLGAGDTEPLGAAQAVREHISRQLGNVDWANPAWGAHAGDGFSIEFNVGEDDPIQDVMLHVRGAGDALAAIVRVARPAGWSALDCSTNEVLDLDNPSRAGWEGFQAYRDRVVKPPRERRPKS